MTKSKNSGKILSVLQVAQLYWVAGLSIIPLRVDGDRKKSPALKWDFYKQYQAELEEVEKWFRKGHLGIGIVCGAVSNNLEVIDIDNGETVEPFRKLVPDELWTKLTIVRTPREGGGCHVIYRCPVIGGNQPLARGSDWNDENGRERFGKALIETRGEGGYIVGVGGHPDCHPTGKPYVHVEGPGVDEVGEITPEERAVLFEAARSLNQSKKWAGDRKRKESRDSRPYDLSDTVEDYCRRGPEHRFLMAEHGWDFANPDLPCRPGKEGGISAQMSVCEDGHDIVCVFTSNAAPLEAGGKYNRFEVYKHFHSGDHREACEALEALGYGMSSYTGDRMEEDLKDKQIRLLGKRRVEVKNGESTVSDLISLGILLNLKKELIARECLKAGQFVGPWVDGKPALNVNAFETAFSGVYGDGVHDYLLPSKARQKKAQEAKAERKEGEKVIRQVGDREAIYKAITNAMRESGRVFLFSGKPGWVDIQNAFIRITGPAHIQSVCNEAGFQFTRADDVGDIIQDIGKVWVLRDHDFPEIVSIKKNPSFDLNWEISKPGYNESSGIYYTGDPVKPIFSTERIRGLLSMFYWKTDGDATNYVGMLLSGLLMEHCRDTGKPAFLFEGNQPNLGKTELGKCINRILTDDDSPPIDTSTPEEMRKRLETVAFNGGTSFLFDNVRGQVRNSYLEAQLTADVCEFRKLGSSTSVKFTNDFLWMFTANNFEASSDMINRMVTARLWKEDEPESGRPSPIKYANEHRQEILAELVGMVLTWVSIGGEVETEFRFQKWAAIVGGILECHGFKGFLDNLSEVVEACSVERIEENDLAERLLDWMEEDKFYYPKDLISVSGLPASEIRSSTIKIGQAIKRQTGKILNGKMLTSHESKTVGNRDGVVYSVKIVEN